MHAYTQAQTIIQAQGFALLPQSLVQQALHILDQMMCEGPGQPGPGDPGLVKDRQTVAKTLKAGGSSMQGPIQTKLSNKFYLQVRGMHTCMHACILYIHTYIPSLVYMRRTWKKILFACIWNML
jgi:hypothetical protein